MPAAGAFVPTVDYYNRLIITGDLVITDPPSEPAGGEPTTQPNATPDAATPTPEEK
jgi:hypothetical protein